VPQRQIDIRHGPIAGKLTVRNRNTGRPATHTFHSNFSPLYIACLFRINQYLIRWPRATRFARPNYFVGFNAPCENCARVKLVTRMPLFPHRHSVYLPRETLFRFSP